MHMIPYLSHSGKRSDYRERNTLEIHLSVGRIGASHVHNLPVLYNNNEYIYIIYYTLLPTNNYDNTSQSYLLLLSLLLHR